MSRNNRIRRINSNEPSVRPALSLESWVSVNSFAHLHSVDLSTAVQVGMDALSKMDKNDIEKLIQNRLNTVSQKTVSENTV